jgi:hypothetical protein
MCDNAVYNADCRRTAIGFQLCKAMDNENHTLRAIDRSFRVARQPPMMSTASRLW